MRQISDEGRSSPKPHKVTQRLSSEEISELVSAYEAGASPSDLGRRYELAQTTVTNLLVAQGITGSSRSGV